MARCGCGGSSGGGGCACSLVDGNGTSVSGVGSSGSPYQVGVKPDPVAGNLVTVTAAGVAVSCEAVQDCVGGALDTGLVYDDAGNKMRVKLSVDAGNTVVFGTDGGVFSPSGDVALGCGLQVDGGGAIEVKGVDYATLTRRGCGLEADTAPVPLGGDDTLGAGVYCDTDGVLRTMPEKFTISREVATSESYTVPQSFPFDTAVSTLALTNPSTSYCVCGVLEMACEFSVDSTIDANPRVEFLFDLDGDGVLDRTVAVWEHDTRGVSGTTRQHKRPVAVVNFCLSPGATVTVSFRAHFEYGDAQSGGFSSVNAASREIRFVGSNV